jgi:hypothetical protein
LPLDVRLAVFTPGDGLDGATLNLCFQRFRERRDYYLRQAEEVENLAREIADPIARRSFHDVAAAWRKLADTAVSVPTTSS